MPYLPIQRSVSTGLQIKLLFGSAHAWIGWIFLFMGMWFSYIFVGNTDFSMLFLGKNSPQAEGVIVGIEQTSARVNKRYVFAYKYSFSTDKGKEFFGTSYSTTTKPKVGDIVQVLYWAGKPSYSKIAGMDMSTFPIIVSLVLLFPIVGVIFVRMGFIQGQKQIYLLKVGELGYGRLLRYESTGAQVNNRPEQRMFFELEVKGQKYEVIAKSHLPEYLTDEPLEVLFYHPDKPQDAVLKDALPARPRLIDGRTLERISLFRVLHLFILPILSFLSLLFIFL